MSQKRREDRAWRILAKFMEERQRRIDAADLGQEIDEDRELVDLGEAARQVLNSESFQLLRMDGMRRLVEEFVRWLELDPAAPRYGQELTGIHYRASAIYYELFRLEEIRGEVQELKNREKGGASHDGDDGKTGRRRPRR